VQIQNIGVCTGQTMQADNVCPRVDVSHQNSTCAQARDTIDATEEQVDTVNIELCMSDLHDVDYDSCLGQLDVVSCMRVIERSVMANSIAFRLSSNDHAVEGPVLKQSIQNYLTDVWSQVISRVVHDFMCYGLSVIAFEADQICGYRPQVLDMPSLTIIMKTDMYDKKTYVVQRATIELLHVVVLEHTFLELMAR
jgi:hypothetical protein